jgi:hypothetical protein
MRIKRAWGGAYAFNNRSREGRERHLVVPNDRHHPEHGRYFNRQVGILPDPGTDCERSHLATGGHRPKYPAKISNLLPMCGVLVDGLARNTQVHEVSAVWNQPYLETCCRAALHRLYLAGPAGRPADQMDGPCLVRLSGIGLCDRRSDGCFTLNPAGADRHATEVLKRPMTRSAALKKEVP